VTEARTKTRRAKVLVWLTTAATIAALGALAFVALEFDTRDRLEVVERADPCVTLGQVLDGRPTPEQVRSLTIECRTFLAELGPLIPLRLACAIIEEARYACPAPGTEKRPQSNDVDAPALGPTIATEGAAAPLAPVAGGGEAGGDRQPPRGEEDTGGGDGGGKDKGDGDKREPEPADEAAPTAPDPVGDGAAPGGGSSTPPPTSPGDQGSGGGKGAGVNLCVEAIVSACVDAGVRGNGQTPLP
jgi:hypothetical protein